MAETTITMLSTAASKDEFEYPEVNIFFAIFLPLLSLVTVIGNVMIIVAFWKLPSLHEKPSELLILNLSCVDLLTGLLVLPVQSLVYIVPGYWPLGEVGCRLQAISLQTNIYASLFTLIAISADRCLLVFKEYPVYRRMQSLVRIRITVIICWLAAFLAAMIEQVLWNPAKSLDETAALIDFNKTCLTPPRRLQPYTMTVFLAVYFGPVATVCALSTIFLYLLRRRLKKTERPEASALTRTRTNGLDVDGHSSHSQARPSMAAAQVSHQTSRNRYIKPAVSLFAVVISMAICMLPYCFYVITIELFCPKCNNPRVLFILLLLQFCNACLDPVLFGMTQKKIRHFYGSCIARNIILPA